MSQTTIERRQLAFDTAANWTAQNPILAVAEEGYETDTGKRKIGDGATAWNSLDYEINKAGNGGGSFAVGALSVTGGASVDIATKLETAAPSTYPTGLSSFVVSNDASWPYPYGHAETMVVGTDRARQTYYRRASPYDVWMRYKTDGADTWTTWMKITKV